MAAETEAVVALNGSPPTYPPPTAPPYDRRLYEHWIDADGDCQNTRQEVLIAESLEPVTLDSSGCHVESGRWFDSFTGQEFSDPADLDIDHIVPLAEAHLSGAAAWTADRRTQYANDLTNPDTLIAVATSANRSKGDRDPSEWLPTNESFQCDYVARWIMTKARWALGRQYKKKYRIRNWREYERGLRSRGDVTIWLSEDAIAAWVPPKNGLRGGQRRYSNLAVRTALTLRVVFSLPLRQTEGFLDSLLRLMGLNLKAPDHTTLSRRNQIVAVPPLTRSHDGPIDLIVDSTGLKILGCGEWNAHKHKASKKRRDWRKLHIGVDAEGFIVAAELTASSRDAASTLPALLDTIEVPIRRFTADGAYDHRSVYDQLSAAGTENVVIVIPPRRSALSAGPTDGPWAQRDTALERIRQVGRREWQKESGYRQQARVENSFFRYKSVLGGGLKARHGKAQRREVAIGCHILNRMAELGRPKSCAVVS